MHSKPSNEVTEWNIESQIQALVQQCCPQVSAVGRHQRAKVEVYMLLSSNGGLLTHGVM